MKAFTPIRGLHHFAYCCRDAEETRRFYEDLLSLPLIHVVRQDIIPSTQEHCPYVHLFFEMHDGSCVAFFDLGNNTLPLPSPNTPRWANHLALKVDNVEAVELARKRLVDAGIDVIGPVDHDGFVSSIYFFDPNGIRLELTTDTADAIEHQRYRKEAHEACAAWNIEKQARLASSAGQPTSSGGQP
ncbi:VOC family protein [Diaphorobacter aerolatus]|uniref:VOC family protein n=1 Tax=Diaphorobacter aerolatus TaxID=1288495 RepID=A0A7H0GL15_9BURK|nr:VOC family protein [Diaphorobacter aerolatus]QNP48981.1 VOC family protein [Diaphorobacter aerolatus]